MRCTIVASLQMSDEPFLVEVYFLMIVVWVTLRLPCFLFNRLVLLVA